MAQNDWSASAEFSRMRKEGITGSRNPIRSRIENRELLRNVKNGSLQNDVMRMPTEGRERLNNLGSGVNMDGMARTLGRTAV